MKVDYPISPFANKKKWTDWLAKRHDKALGVWLKLAKRILVLPL